MVFKYATQYQQIHRLVVDDEDEIQKFLVVHGGCSAVCRVFVDLIVFINSIEFASRRATKNQSVQCEKITGLPFNPARPLDPKRRNR
jgi:hypothetical protein